MKKPKKNNNNDLVGIKGLRGKKRVRVDGRVMVVSGSNVRGRKGINNPKLVRPFTGAVLSLIGKKKGEQK